MLFVTGFLLWSWAGDLEPPGPPASTMKTLDEVQREFDAQLRQIPNLLRFHRYDDLDAFLTDAQENPEQYRTLIVRVAGYSDYFCDLSKTLQDEIIGRTEHESF